jgi:uncharacterized protein with HEPN domain
MGNKSNKLLQDILEAIVSIDEHLQGKRQFNVYLQNKTMRRSVERELEIIGEATNNLEDQPDNSHYFTSKNSRPPKFNHSCL